MLTTILAAAVVLGVLIFVHELGHFITAKWVDIEVPRFSIGFGPKVLGFRRGETEYVLSLLPLGGYVKMAGMEEMEPIEGGSATAVAEPGPGETTLPRTDPKPAGRGPRDFESKTIAQRTLVISAGVIMNLLFAYVVFAAIGMFWGVPKAPEAVLGNIVEELLPEGSESLAGLPAGLRLTHVGDTQIETLDDLRIALSTARSGPVVLRFDDREPITVEIPTSDSARQSLIAAFEPIIENEAVLDSVVEDSRADEAGLEAGDRILTANGQPVSSWQQFGHAIEESPERPLPVTVLRGSDTVGLTVVPERRTVGDRGYGRIGVTTRPPILAIEREHLGPGSALVYGFTETWRWVALTVDVLGGIFTGRMSARSVGGPILITQISGEAARAGFETFLTFMALLSVNLAVLNILPIPVLDGGHLVFLLIEAVRGRPVPIEQRIRLTKVGMVLIFALMVFALGNDIVRWIGL
jgi:regulator of sigma E protease